MAFSNIARRVPWLILPRAVEKRAFLAVSSVRIPWYLAESAAKQTQVNLLGLAQTGLDYQA